ncbi:DUF2905 family protein [Candidatus Dependentiae bacterium]|nr:DUF2905 family protein [Candidatus Dependentiae bacterium]
MNNLGNILLFIGFLLIIFGIIFKFLPNFRLPGDILIQKKNVTFYFPIATCIILSLIFSIIFFVLNYFFKK